MLPSNRNVTPLVYKDQVLRCYGHNLSLDQLAQRVGERIVWRIAEMCESTNVVEVKGKNLREL